MRHSSQKTRAPEAKKTANKSSKCKYFSQAVAWASNCTNQPSFTVYFNRPENV
ncbi:hypothetical protein AMK01_CH04203 [Rhizobium sp. N6212]|nr:hypothetical protein AMK02_CH04132 [Rhizobium sp. N731]ANK93594.1 hypothetical protein AMK01_CH04203 [Rhizobium sp. N6212]ANK99640.1 hypothetical protein AMK00_CH04206 [Rhizobium sp. N621]ANL05770.1 hypothetical protein AMJ99_CH04284 [Rhizobium esperanzae]ANL11824.1 hypothetical protein AMJ98_CH04234 [Rhizobium sp. N1341]ANL17895.1 hypothetical protein AMJ97_CH04130 [Rhizobium sp. N1314]ANL23899.1 hypothetical protein AMJ96_CH04256 [Rhizobium sp. N113]ANM36611.1 hypothetical protein AMK04